MVLIGSICEIGVLYLIQSFYYILFHPLLRNSGTSNMNDLLAICGLENSPKRVTLKMNVFQWIAGVDIA